MIERRFLLAVVLVTAASPSAAQPRPPIERFVMDARVASAGLPSAEGWTPTVPSGTVLPARSLAVDIGAHVYFLRFRGGALGFGGNLLRAKGNSRPADVDVSSNPPPVQTIPEVSTTLTSLNPQLSLNFGHALGWSYLSAGLGQSKVSSVGMLGQLSARRDSGWIRTLNFGGGARWLINDHVGVGFDVRWYKLGSTAATATQPGAPRASLVVAGAGVVVK